MFLKPAPEPKENNHNNQLLKCEWIPAESKPMLVRRSAVFSFLAMRIIFGENSGFQFSVNLPVASGCKIEKSWEIWVQEKTKMPKKV